MGFPNDMHDNKGEPEVYSLTDRRTQNDAGAVADELGGGSIKGYTVNDRRDMWRMGKYEIPSELIASVRAGVSDDCVGNKSSDETSASFQQLGSRLV